MSPDPSFGEVPHVDVVQRVKDELVQRGDDLSGPDGAFEITRRVAWALKDDGAGLLTKPDGTNASGFAVDIIAYPNGAIVDILVDSGGRNEPAWQPQGFVAPSRWVAPTQPLDAVDPPPPPPPPDVLPAVDDEAGLDDALLAFLDDIENVIAALADIATALHAQTTELQKLRDEGVRIKL